MRVATLAFAAASDVGGRKSIDFRREILHNARLFVFNPAHRHLKYRTKPGEPPGRRCRLAAAPPAGSAHRIYGH
jgi:hypothetical protein